MTDRIDLAGIEVLAKHGVYPEEKERLQPFIVDVTAHLDLAPAGRSDDLADTLDYGALASEIEKVVASESHQLIEGWRRRWPRRSSPTRSWTGSRSPSTSPRHRWRCRCATSP